MQENCKIKKTKTKIQFNHTLVCENLNRAAMQKLLAVPTSFQFEFKILKLIIIISQFPACSTLINRRLKEYRLYSMLKLQFKLVIIPYIFHVLFLEAINSSTILLCFDSLINLNGVNVDELCLNQMKIYIKK